MNRAKQSKQAKASRQAKQAPTRKASTRCVQAGKQAQAQAPTRSACAHAGKRTSVASASVRTGQAAHERSECKHAGPSAGVRKKGYLVAGVRHACERHGKPIEPAASRIYYNPFDTKL